MLAVVAGKVDAAKVAVAFLAKLPRQIVVSVNERDLAKDFVDCFQPRWVRHKGMIRSLRQQGSRDQESGRANDE